MGQERYPTDGITKIAPPPQNGPPFAVRPQSAPHIAPPLEARLGFRVDP